MGLIVKITKQHIEMLKAHRLFCAWVPNLNAYLDNDNSIGWLSVGSQLTFYSAIEIEPYAAIYGSPYIGGKGTMPTSGLCSIGFNSYSHSPLPEKMQHATRLPSLSMMVALLMRPWLHLDRSRCGNGRRALRTRCRGAGRQGAQGEGRVAVIRWAAACRPRWPL